MPTLEQRVLIELLAGEISGKAELCEEELKTADWAGVLEEAKVQAVPLMAAEAIVRYREYIPNYREWENIAVAVHTVNIRTAYEEQKLGHIMENRPFLILKGMAAASYYPKPHERSLGDIDFLIDASQQQEIEELLSENGYQGSNRDHDCHVVFKKGSADLEMHFAIPGIPKGRTGEIVKDFISDMLNRTVNSELDGISFPAPEDIYHGLIIILHMQGHMVSEGLGLRHICDWACFLQKTDGKPFWNELLDLFQKIGILTYAEIISKICSMYFHINCPVWAEGADEELCRDVMNDVLTGGNFGRKDSLRSKSGVMTVERSRKGKKHGKFVNLLLIIHYGILERYPIVKKIPILYPAFYCYRVLLYFVRTLKGERVSLIKLVPAANQRKSVYDRLHLFETENNGGK